MADFDRHATGPTTPLDRIELEQEKQFNDDLVNSLPGVFYVFDTNLRFRRWNATFERVTGYSPAEFAGLTPLELFAEDERDLVAERIGEVFTTGASTVDAHLVAKDGSRTPYHFTGRRTEVAGETFLVGMGVDISRRRQFEAERDRLMADMGERIKELRCLHAVTEAIRTTVEIDGMLGEVARLLPPGWQHPEVTRGRIVFDGRAYVSEEFKPTPRRLAADIVVEGRVRGQVEVYLVEDLHGGDGESFLAEERDLIGSIAKAVGEALARRETELRFRRLIEQAPVPMAYVSAEGEFIYFNRRFGDTFGYSESELRTIDDWWVRAYPDPDYRREVVARWTAAVERAQAEETDVEPAEYVVTCGNGDQLVMEISGVVIEDAFLATFNNLTDRRRVEDDLRASQQLYRSLFTSVPVSIWDEDWSNVIAEVQALKDAGVVDLAMFFEDHPEVVQRCLQAVRITEVNQATLSMFGADSKEQLVESLETVFATPDTLPGFVGELVALADGQRTYHTEMRLNTVQGDRITVMLTMSFPHEDDPSGRVLVCLMDIGELQQTLSALERSNTDLEQFAYVASHDLQEPLRMVASYLQLIERRYRDSLDDDGREFIEYAVDGARRMKRMINDLLAFSRIGTRGSDLVPTPSVVAFERARESLRAAIDDSCAEITVADLPTVRADENQLESLFRNLLSNAIKFRGDRTPQIQVSAARDGDRWVFSVRDSGLGIEPGYAEKVFVIFQRLHSASVYPGSGIGLAMCRRIVDRHGGRIWFESEPGEGTTFHFTLEAADA